MGYTEKLKWLQRTCVTEKPLQNCLPVLVPLNLIFPVGIMEQIQLNYHTDTKMICCNVWKELELLVLLEFMSVGEKETPPLGERQEEDCARQKAYVGNSAICWEIVCAKGLPLIF